MNAPKHGFDGERAKPGPKPRPLGERFWSKVDKRGPDECWHWLAKVSHGGYGRFDNDAAHRVSYMMANVAIPPGLWVLHRCDNPLCVNPAHLFVGTRTDNVRDMWAKGRGWIKNPRGAEHYGAKLTEQLVREIRESPERNCTVARRLNISRSLVGNIRTRRAWAWVT